MYNESDFYNIGVGGAIRLFFKIVQPYLSCTFLANFIFYAQK